MRVLLTGGTGQLGRELRPLLEELGPVSAPGREEMDLARPDELRRAVADLAPDLVVNAAAFTDVDAAEERPEEARAVNAEAPGVLAEACREAGAGLVHVSTDYVFDGAAEAPYTEEDAPNPVNVYGATKLAGERAVAASGAPHLILRTAWLYGAGGSNFVNTMLELMRERDTLRVVDDQRGSPTWCRTFARGTLVALRVLAEDEGTVAGGMRRLATEDGGALFHLAARGHASRYEQAGRIRRETHRLRPDAGYDGCALEPNPSAEYPQEAPRPPFTALEVGRFERTFGVDLPGWEASLVAYLEEALAGG